MKKREKWGITERFKLVRAHGYSRKQEYKII